MLTKIDKLLVANRGEIAIRIARAAIGLGIGTVAIHSLDDAGSPHLDAADAAIGLPLSGPRAYLDQKAIIDAAIASGCVAVHPGYGFLSENAGFARRCADAGLIFVGPSPEALALFGDKASARRLAQRLGIPLLPGTTEAVTLEDARAFMQSLGPGGAMMLKAISGGGGRGMRIVTDVATLDELFASCALEAEKAFGNGALYVERMVVQARHVEVQVVGDGQGGIAHLGERECSLQRRHQKLVEIAPAPNISGEMREALCAAACRMAGEVNYAGLCTFEFLVDSTDPTRFWFMEANPRVQVEHTITEEVTGIDLVASQIRIAQGETLTEIGLPPPLEPSPRGYAIQLRLNAESPGLDGAVRPASGRIVAYDMPSGPGVRIDGYGRTGYQLNPSFDSLLAKIIVTQRGVQDATTYERMLDRAARALREVRVDGVATNAALLSAILATPEVQAGHVNTRFVEDHWDDLVRQAEAQPDRAAEPKNEAATMPVAGSRSTPVGMIAVRSPMSGNLSNLTVATGDRIRVGQTLAILEAMKMEHLVVAPATGFVRETLLDAGAFLSEGDPLFFLEPTEMVWDVAEQEADTLDLDAIPPTLADELARRARRLDEARPDAVVRREQAGQRTLRTNIADLMDADSFVEYGGLALASQRRRREPDDLARIAPGDGMVTGIGTVNAELFPEAGRCMAVGYDYTVFAGTQGWANHRKLERMLRLASRDPMPFVLFAEGGGGRSGDTDQMRATGLDNTNFANLARLSGRVPLVGIASGFCFAGNAALLGCSDIIIATRNASIGMGGPAMIEGGGLGVFEPGEVGPLSIQVTNGVVDVVVNDEVSAVATARQYLSYFQGRLTEWDCADQRTMRHLVPENRMRVYDVREVIRTLADEDSVLELRPEFGVGIVTALIRIEGRPVAILANDTCHISGALDSAGADKGARFLKLCDIFRLPVVSLCDTPGFMVGPDSERTGAVRHMSRIFLAGANVTVPWITIVLRKGYGLGAMAMAGGGMHESSLTVAWPTAEFGGMGLEGAVRLGYRKELAAITDLAERERHFRGLVAQLYEGGRAYNAASYVEIDDVIDPMETRSLIAKMLATASLTPTAGHHRYLDSW